MSAAVTDFIDIGDLKSVDQRVCAETMFGSWQLLSQPCTLQIAANRSCYCQLLRGADLQLKKARRKKLRPE